MYVVARLSFGFAVGVLAVVLALQGAVWLFGQLGLSPVQLFPMRAPLPASLPGLTQPALIGGLWGLFFILIWDRWGREGVVKGAAFGILFGLVGPGLVLWVVWPAFRGRRCSRAAMPAGSRRARRSPAPLASASPGSVRSSTATCATRCAEEPRKAWRSALAAFGDGDAAEHEGERDGMIPGEDLTEDQRARIADQTARD